MKRRQRDGHGDEPRIDGWFSRSNDSLSVKIHGGLDRHTGGAAMLRILIFIEPNPHGNRWTTFT